MNEIVCVAIVSESIVVNQSLLSHAFQNSCNQIFSIYRSTIPPRLATLASSSRQGFLVAGHPLWLTAYFLTSCVFGFSCSCAFGHCLVVCRRLGICRSAEGSESVCVHPYPAVQSGHRIALIGLARHRFDSCAWAVARLPSCCFAARNGRAGLGLSLRAS